ncbi:hypothetical protein [Kitasatospora paranensis]|uniref:Uncharacterized protein n=1 Tax=Kitasatospora paranensis TaxID=258053 RepID=A0ABW2G2L8_9ACTN
MHGVDESGSGPARPATTGLPSPASAGIPGRPAPGGRERAPAAPGGVLHPDTLRLWAHAVDLADWDWVVHLGARDGTLLTAVDLPPHAAVVAAAPDGSALPGLWHDLVPTVPQARVLSLTPGDRAPAAPPVLDGLGLHPEHALLARVDLDDRGAPVLRESLPGLRALARCALVVAVERLGPGDLDWLTTYFQLSCLRTDSGQLLDCSRLTGHQLTLLLNRPDVHDADVLAVPRAPGTPVPRR